jgi:ABC-2 type transport system permease protein
MTGLVYTRYELVRAFRARRFFVFSLGFPLLLYFVIAGSNRGVHNFDGTGISLPLYYMVGLASFGTMMAMISTGGRIAGERQAGWTRQLRVTPLSARAYFRAKVVTAYAMALLTIVLLYAAGASLGVSIPAARWLEMTGLILVGLLPFAALGIMIGHLVTTDSVGPVLGGLSSLLALLSGTWFPITSGFLHTLGRLLPSWWLVQAGRVAVDRHDGWGARGWATVAAWTAILVVLAAWAYRRDTNRV